MKQFRNELLLGNDDDARRGALALRDQFNGVHSLEARHIVTQCMEIVRDTGQQGDPLIAIAKIALLSRKVEEAWALQREYVNLAFALLTHANLYRINLDLLGENYLRAAMKLVNGAECILRGKCVKSDLGEATLLLHHATWLKLALTAFDARQPEDAHDLVQELRELAPQIGTRSTLLKTAKEEVDYYTCMGEFDLAEQRMAECKALAGQHYEHRPLSQLGLWRTEIELNLAKGKSLAAQEILSDYLALFARYPYVSHANHLRRIRAKYRLGVGLSMPTLNRRQNPHLIYPYLDNGLDGPARIASEGDLAGTTASRAELFIANDLRGVKVTQ